MKKLRHYILAVLILVSTVGVARPVDTLQLRSFSIINPHAMQLITVALLGKLAMMPLNANIVAGPFVREGGAGILLSTKLG